MNLCDQQRLVADHEALAHRIRPGHNDLAGLASLRARRASLEQSLQAVGLVEETERDAPATLLGFLPQAMFAELRDHARGQDLLVEVAPEIPDLPAIWERRGEQMTIRVRETTVAKGRPRYVILHVPPAEDAP